MFNYGFLLFLFVTIDLSDSESLDGKNDNAVVSLPLLNNLKAALKAEIDVSELNNHLTSYIQKEVQKGVKAELKDFILKAIDDKTERAKVQIEESVEHKFSALRQLQVPAFNAVLSKDFTPPVNQIIKFDTVLTNIGGHYSPNTGIFTAPKGGLYTFSATIRSNGGKYLHCEIHVNDKMYEKAFGTNYSTGSINAVLQLKKGDKVCIKKDYRSGGEYMLGRGWSMFSGYMIA